MLEVEGVEAHYGRSKVLQGVDLKIGAGECVAVLGRNGVGKTTLMKAIVGLLPLSAGAVRLGDTDVSRFPAYQRARRGLSYVAQGEGVFPNLSVRDNLAAAAPTNSRSEALRLAEATIEEEFPVLRTKWGVRAASLSGGQRRLLALSCVLIRRPNLVLLDEPTEGVQPSLVDELKLKLIDLRERKSLSVLVVEQRLEFVAGLASRAHIMVKGSLVKEVEPHELLADVDMQHEYLGI